MESRRSSVEGGSGRREHDRTTEWWNGKKWNVDMTSVAQMRLIYMTFFNSFFFISRMSTFFILFFPSPVDLSEFEFFWQICWLPTTQPWWRWRQRRDDAYVGWWIQLTVNVDAHRSRWNDYRTRKRRSTLTCDRHRAQFILISKNFKSNSISREIDEPSLNQIRQRRLYGWYNTFHNWSRQS